MDSRKLLDEYNNVKLAKQLDVIRVILKIEKEM